MNRTNTEINCIPGSQLIPLGEIPRRYAELDPERKTMRAVQVGGRSAKAADYLRTVGFKRKAEPYAHSDRVDKVDPSQPSLLTPAREGREGRKAWKAGEAGKAWKGQVRRWGRSDNARNWRERPPPGGQVGQRRVGRPGSGRNSLTRPVRWGKSHAFRARPEGLG